MKVPEIHVLVRIPPWSAKGLPVFWYGVMLLVGFVAGMWLARRLARREGVPPETIYDLALLGIVSGLVGARLWYVAEFAGRFYSGPDAADTLIGHIGRTVNVSDGGLVFYGGIILPIIVLMWWFRRRRLPALKMLDILAPAAMLGLSFGRIGCTFNGCCFGKVCGSGFPLGIRRPAGGPTWSFQVHHGLISKTADWSLPVHPTQLYSWAGALIVCALLLWFYRRKRRDGDILALLLLLYPTGRFLIEMLREHEPSETFGLLSVSQAVSLLAILTGAVLLIGRRHRPAAVAYVPPEPPEKAAAEREPKAKPSSSKPKSPRPKRRRPPRRRR